MSLYITKEQLEQRISFDKTVEEANPTAIVVPIENNQGRKEGGRNFTDSEKILAGILAKEDGLKKTAEFMGMSPVSVNNYSKGITSPSSGIDSNISGPVKEGQKNVENKIKDDALNVLSEAIASAAAGIGYAKATDASKIAVDMSRIIKDLDKTERGDRGGNKVAIIIHAPRQKDESDYETITV